MKVPKAPFQKAQKKNIHSRGTNISHLGNRKIIFKMPFWGDMLVSWRVSDPGSKKLLPKQRNQKSGEDFEHTREIGQWDSTYRWEGVVHHVDLPIFGRSCISKALWGPYSTYHIIKSHITWKFPQQDSKPRNENQQLSCKINQNHLRTNAARGVRALARIQGALPNLEASPTDL